MIYKYVIVDCMSTMTKVYLSNNKLASMSEDRYPRRVFSQDWDAKPHRGMQRKVWSRLIDNIFGSLEVDKAEWRDKIEKGDSSLKAMVEESIGERESKKFVEGLKSKVKLAF